MGFIVFGLNYQTAPLEVREKVSFNGDGFVGALQKFHGLTLAKETFLISTCNRTELYFFEVDLARVWSVLIDLLSTTQEALQPYIYIYSNREAVLHLMAVSSGLESMVLGEAEILGQVKQAYSIAKEVGTVGKYLNRLIEITFQAAKKVRTETGIGMNPLSVAFLAVRLSQRIFTHLNTLTVLLVGAGHLVHQTAEYLVKLGIHKLIIANRSFEKGKTLGLKWEADVIGLQEIPSRLKDADIVVTATASPLPILGKGMIERALKERKRKPVLMIDFAIPRNIEPEVGQLEDVYLYHLDDLEGMADENRRMREAFIPEAKAIIQTEALKFEQWIEADEALKMVSLLRKKFETTKEILLKEALRQIELGESAEAVLKRFAHQLTNQLLHLPSHQLRQAGLDGNKAFLDFTKQLYELNHETIHL